MVFMKVRFGWRHQRDEQGAVAVLTAFVMVGLMICAAIVIDLGNARDVRRQSQNASDAASLAGANKLYPAGNCTLDAAKPCIKDAEAAVKTYASLNFQVSDSDWALPPCTTAVVPAVSYLPDASNKCIWFDSRTSPTLVHVIMPTRAAPTFFGGFAGWSSSSIPVGSSAEALVKPAVKCSLCVLGDVTINNPNFTVTGGSIAVDGDVNTTNSVWTATGIGIHGYIDPQATYNPPATVIDHFTDPLAGLAMPSTSLTTKTNPCTQGPGKYVVNVDISALLNPTHATTCTLTSGLYVISGTWLVKNNDLLAGDGVTLYVQSPGYLNFKNGLTSLSAPSIAQAASTGGVAGYVIIYDPAYTGMLSLQGNGTTGITGAVYAPAATVDFNGGTQFGFSGGPIVVGAINAVGSSGLTVSNAESTTVTNEVLHLNK